MEFKEAQKIFQQYIDSELRDPNGMNKVSQAMLAYWKKMDEDQKTFRKDQLVRKKGDKGQWHGRVCGFYSTSCTPDGVAVESIYERNSVQIYPASALEEWDGKE